MVTDLTSGLSPEDHARTSQVIADSGSRWALMGVRWADIERYAKGDYYANAVARTDAAVASAEAAGNKVIMTVYDSPEWASGSTNPHTPPQDLDDYADFLTWLATRYRCRVDAYEIWNEEDLYFYWEPAPEPDRYAQMLDKAHDAVKQADPGALVLFGGTQFNDYAFLEQVYAADPNAGDNFDAMAVHPYVMGGAPPEEAKDEEPAGHPDGRVDKYWFPAYREVRKSLDANGDEDKPIFMTELGWSTSETDPWGVTPEEQAAYLTRAYAMVDADPQSNVAVVVWYNLRNNWWRFDGQAWDAQLGLLRSNFDPKPSWYTYKAIPSAPASPPRCPAAVPGEGSGGSGSGSGSGSDGGGTSTPAAKEPTSTSLTVRRLAARTSRADSAAQSSRRVVLSGLVRNARRGVVRVTVQRRSGRRWRTVTTRGRLVRPTGGFRPVELVVAAPGRWRARAVFLGTFDRLASASSWRSFVVPAPRHGR